MKGRSAWVAVLAASVMAAGCGQKAKQEVNAAKVEHAMAELGIAAVWQAYRSAGPAADLKAYVDIYSNEVAYSAPGTPTLRRLPAVREYLADKFKKSHYLETDVLLGVPMIEGDHAMQFGSYWEIRSEDGKNPHATDYGQFAAELRRESDGKWRIWRHQMTLDSSVVWMKPKPAAR